MVHFEYQSESSDRSSVTVERVLRKEIDTVRQSACPCVRMNLSATHVISYLNNEDITPEEREAAYYSSSELKEMKYEARATAKWLASDVLTTTKIPGFSSRGLETVMHPELAKEKRSARRSAATVVFLEQETQCEEGLMDDEMIAEEYARETFSSKLRAHTLAMQDAEDALYDL
eukprot:Nitzschia sp. Nitz4//scaffold159_size51929//37051//37572//NITZ4_006883-RA/size51929-processed-gene-0.53-mRNA-1//-1//CDS//3329537586//6392//frame0